MNKNDPTDTVPVNKNYPTGTLFNILTISSSEKYPLVSLFARLLHMSFMSVKKNVKGALQVVLQGKPQEAIKETSWG